MTTNIILIAALLGLIISLYLLRQKERNQKIFCPLGDDCNEVLYSKYSKIFGIQTLTLGSLYYLALIVWMLALLLTPYVLTRETIIGASIISALATLFSFYQAFIQLAILKKWCSWCLTSMVLNMIILVACLSFAS